MTGRYLFNDRPADTATSSVQVTPGLTHDSPSNSHSVNIWTNSVFGSSTSNEFRVALSHLGTVTDAADPVSKEIPAYLNRNPTNQHKCRPEGSRNNPRVAFRRHLMDLLSGEPRSVSSLARELGMKRGDVEEDLRHALRSARAAGQQIEVIPARCKSCDFVFGEDKLTKPSRCPSCKETRLFEPMIRLARTD